MWNDNEAMIKIYNKFHEGHTKFPCECPNCKRNSVHMYIHQYGDSRCGIWIWCSECGGFSHMSGIVPKDWKNPDFIDPNQLCADADYLEAQVENIDKWMNNQVICTKGKSKDACIEDRFNAKLKTDLQGILAGTEGVLVVKNDLVTVKVVFIPKNGKAVEILLPHDELLKAIEIL